MGIWNLFRPRQDNDVMPAAIMTAILSLLPAQREQDEFRTFLHEHPPLLGRVMTLNRAAVRPTGDILTRLEIASILVSYASLLQNSGDFPNAAGSLFYSMIFLKENPGAWAGMAEVYVAWEDLIAARWAKKFLECRRGGGESEILDEVFSKPSTVVALQGLKLNMQAVIQKCSEHPEWRDSYSLRKAVFDDL